jgi:hypothetical protein
MRATLAWTHSWCKQRGRNDRQALCEGEKADAADCNVWDSEGKQRKQVPMDVKEC